MGVGGGVFLVPLLVLALHIPIHQAIAVSLAAIIATSSAVASVNVERGLANMRLGITLEVTTAIGSIAGALFANSLPSETIRTLFALMLFPISALMFLKGRGGLKRPVSEAVGAADHYFFDPSINSRVGYKVKNLKAASIMSFFAGSLSGLLGLGGGILQVPVMNLMCGVPMKAAAATSNFIIGVSAAASAIVYFRKGLFVPELSAVVVMGVILGSFVGIKVLYKARSEKIQMVFSVLVLAVALKMLYG